MAGGGRYLWSLVSFLQVFWTLSFFSSLPFFFFSLVVHLVLTCWCSKWVHEYQNRVLPGSVTRARCALACGGRYFWSLVLLPLSFSLFFPCSSLAVGPPATKTCRIPLPHWLTKPPISSKTARSVSQNRRRAGAE